MGGSLSSFHEACRNIVKASTVEKPPKALNYATHYAIHGMGIKDEYEAKVQALYILNNITHWRGVVAKESRALLKEFSQGTAR